MEVSGQFHSRFLYPRGKSSWYPLRRGLGGPGTGMDAVAKESLCPYRESNPRRPVRSGRLRLCKVFFKDVSNSDYVTSA
jgi:hypothetical protein